MNGGQSARRLDELNELSVVPDQPLYAMRACDGRPEGEGLPVLVKIEDESGQIDGSRGGTRGAEKKPVGGMSAGVERRRRTR